MVYKPDGTKVKEGEVITRKKADELLNTIVTRTANEVKKFVDTSKLNDYQFAALISIAYNAGSGGLKSSRINTALKEGKSSIEVANVIKDSLIRSNGVVVRGLINRRAEEAKLFLTQSALDVAEGVKKNKTGVILVVGLIALGLSYYIYQNFKK